jgi:hypothetical protein
MHPLTVFAAIVNQTRYDLSTSTLLAGDVYGDGYNFERRSTNCFLYRSPKGEYFAVRLSQWEGVKSTDFTPLSLDEAVALYQGLRRHYELFDDAFPVGGSGRRR